MKKIISVILAFLTAGTLALPVSAEDDFLLRGSDWKDNADAVTVLESGSYIGLGGEDDSAGHQWFGVRFNGLLENRNYTVRYDFCKNGQLFEVSYFGEESTDNEKLTAEYNNLKEKITAEYGSIYDKTEYDDFMSSEWHTSRGNVTLLMLSGYRVQIFYTAPNFSWDTMDFAAESGITVAEVPLI